MMWTKDYKVGFPPKTCVGGELRENIPTAKGVSYNLYYITQFDFSDFRDLVARNTM